MINPNKNTLPFRIKRRYVNFQKASCERKIKRLEAELAAERLKVFKGVIRPLQEYRKNRSAKKIERLEAKLVIERGRTFESFEEEVKENVNEVL
jgi:hypothetical protein